MGVPLKVLSEAAQEFVNSLTEALESKFENQRGIVVCDLRGVIPDDGWYDELHPTNRGFEAVAVRVADAIEVAVGERADAES